MDNLICHYFRLGHTYRIISQYLRHRHGYRISKRTIERVLSRQGLRRNGISPEISDQSVNFFVSRVQLESDNRAGYRRTWNVINRRYRYRITQTVVRRYLLSVNAVAVQNRIYGVLQRRSYFSRGPNYTWHCDGYDKLKPFGFALHGAIDGFSRKILWIHCSTTNNDPKVILHYYLSTVRERGGVGELLRTDCGTENGLIAAAQCTLRNNSRSHIYGPSYRNQRIECWWSTLRKAWTQIWMDLFDDLITCGLYNPNDSDHLGVAEFCFLRIIQRELSEFQEYWNSHRIRRTSTSGCPGGIPNELYDLPHLHGYQDMLSLVDNHQVQVLFTQAEAPPSTTNHEIMEFCSHLCGMNGWGFPADRGNAANLFLRLIARVIQR